MTPSAPIAPIGLRKSGSARGRFWVPGDFDGFAGLFVDNLCQLLVVVALTPAVAGLPIELVVGRIVPGLAVTLVLGNLFYAVQARRLARQTGKRVTALPFGVNTVSLFAFIFFIMAPVYRQTHDARLAWHVALAAGLLGGLIEMGGAFVGEWVRRHTPRAALLSTLAGAALTFISMGFILQIFSAPLIALFPALLIVVGYTGRVRWPFRLPSGVLAVFAGTVFAWSLRAFQLAPWPERLPLTLGWHGPVPMVPEVVGLLFDPRVWSYADVFIPMALINVIASIQNLESAAAAGDLFATRSSLLVNGGCAVVGVLFGNPFAPTIYIGHPGWKALGAESAYSVFNAVAVSLICLTGAIGWVLWLVPIEVTFGILIWIGIVIVAQAFQEVPKAHAPAVALGLVPALAAWAELLIEAALSKAGPGYTVGEIAPHAAPQLYLVGLLALAQGFVLSSLILAALTVQVIEQRWTRAAAWAALAALLSALGIIHGFVFTASGTAPGFGHFGRADSLVPSNLEFAGGYALLAFVLLLLGWRREQPANESLTRAN